MTVEEWREVPGINHLLVSSFGNVQIKGKSYKPKRRVREYLGVNINKKSYLLHRLILLAFRGFDTDKPEGMHIDGNPLNNNLSNLCWGTHAENMAMDRGNNHSHSKENNPNAKLSTKEVEIIREIYRKRTSYKWGRRCLAQKFGVNEGQILRIAQRSGGGWK